MELSEAQIADLGRRLRILRGELETQLRIAERGDFARGAPHVTPVDWQRREIEQRRRLQLVRAALERLEKEAYGLCQQCGADLGYEQLAAEPEAMFCAACRVHGALPHGHPPG